MVVNLTHNIQNFPDYSGIAYLFKKEIMSEEILFHTSASGFLDSYVGKFQLKVVSFRSSLRRVHRRKPGESSQNLKRKQIKYRADHRRKLRILVWIMPDITYCVGVGYAAHLCGVCASVAHRIAEAVICLCARNCWMNSETAQNSSRTSQQEVKPGLTLATRKKGIVYV
jgi:hypothetical protein